MIRTALRTILAIAALALALPAAAQDGATDDLLTDIGPAEWREMVLGRTVTYRIGGEFWAQEAYDTSGNAVAIRLVDGTCMNGEWSWNDGVFCFAWTGGENSCFRHVRAAGQILVIPVSGGAEGGTIQTVAGVSDLPLVCGPALSS